MYYNKCYIILIGWVVTRPLSKFALLIKTANFCADLSANFEDISEDMAKKLNVKDAKKGYFNEKANFERGLLPWMINLQF